MKNTKLLIAIIASAVVVITGVTLAILFLIPGECKHDSAETSVVIEASCAKSGVSQTLCKDCGEFLKAEKLEKLAHTEVIDAAVAPTCTAAGLTEGKHCSVCNTVTAARKSVAKAPHTYDNASDTDCNVCGETRTLDCTHEEIETISGKSATCTATGLTEGTKCKKCGEIIVAQETLPIVAHTYDNKYDEDCNVCGHKRDAECGHFETEFIKGYAATCIQTGLTDGTKCKKCGKIIVAQETLPIVAHTYDNKYDDDCNVCGYKRDAECGHFEIQIVLGYDSTCTSPGLADGTRCKKCGEILVHQQVIPIKPHREVVDAAIEATCTETGLAEGKHCLDCGKITVVQSTVPAKGHTEVADVAVDATCTETGLTKGKHCSICNAVTVAQTVVPAKGHTEVVDVAVDATCTQTGLTQGKHCSVCSKVLVAQTTVPATGHTEAIDAAVDATCTATGITEGKHCSVCNEVLVAQTVVDVLGHKYSSTVKAPTATKDGFATHTCSRCGDYYEETITPTDFTVRSWNRSLIGYTGVNNESLVIPAVFQNDNVWYRVTSIGDSAFSNCNSLTSVTIPDSVTSMGGHAFEFCITLKTVMIGNGVTSIGVAAFSSCTSLESITIPDSVKAIGSNAFSKCTSLKSVTIGDGVTSIGESSFSWCTSLESVYYTGDVEGWLGINFVSSPMSYATNLYFDGELVTSIVIPDSVTSICNYAFYNCDLLEKVKIHNNVTSIGDYAFSSCTSLESIAIPDSVKTIGSNAFSRCTSLKSVTIPDNVTSIGGAAFSGCDSLESVTILDNVTSIGDAAFSGCDSLESITIPDSVTSIGDYAFSYCTSLKYTEFDNAYYLGNANNPYIVLMYAKDTYITNCKIHPDAKFIHSTAFEDCISLKSVTIPDSVTSIGQKAFYNCSSLTSVTIGDSVTSIGNEAFYNCTSLTSIRIPDSVTNVGDEAFYSCALLKNITIPDSVTNIGSYAFWSCTSLKSVTIGNAVTSIGYGAFCNCTSLENVTLGDSVTSIGSSAFHNCDSLTSITIPDSVTNIGCEAFLGCYLLTSVTFENTDGWRCFPDLSKPNYNTKRIYSENLSNPVTAANYLTYSYCGYYWERKI